MQRRTTPRTKKGADARTLLQYATWLLARRDYSRAELLAKFEARFVPYEDLFIETLDRLASLGLQSDERAAASFIQSHAGWGRQRLLLELRRKKIADEFITALLPDDADELARAREIIAKKLRDADVPTDFRERQKLIAFLARRGFSLDTAKEAMEE